MANRLSMDKSLAIKQLRAAGYSERRIAKTLGISRGAVRRHLTPNSSNSTKTQTGSPQQAPTGSDNSNSTKAQTGSNSALTRTEAGSPTPEKAQSSTNLSASRSDCAPFHEQILQMLEQGLSAKRIYQDLVQDYEFKAKYWSVVRYVAKLSEQTTLPFRRIEVEPGAELQIDFGTGAPVRLANGKYKRTHVFRAVLSHSRKGYSESCFRQTTEDFIRVLENAFWALGGVPKVVVFDNAKCAVKTADWYDPEINPKILEFCKHYRCAFIPTRPRTPQHKGKVERGVDYVQENALKGHQFDSLVEQNEHLVNWEKNVADTRIHGTTQKQVRSQFETVEKPALGKLPSTLFPFYHEGRRRVSRDGHIAVKQAFYSVPPEYLGRKVWVRWDSRILRVLDKNMNVIATHAFREPGKFSTQSAHIDSRKISAVEKGIEYFLEKTMRIGTYASKWAEAMVAKRGVEACRPMQGVLSLCKTYETSAINRACEKAWRSNQLNYRAVKAFLESQTDVQQSTMEFLEDHPIIRSVSEYEEFVQQSV